MQTLTNTQYTGKKAKVGNICFDEKGHLKIFVSYCENCRGKVILDREEAEQFAKKYNSERNKLRTRLFLYEIKRKTHK